MRTCYKSKPYNSLLKYLPLLLPLLAIQSCLTKASAQIKQAVATGAAEDTAAVVHLFKTIATPEGTWRYVISAGDTVDFAMYPVIGVDYGAHAQIGETQINMSFKRVSAWRIDFELAIHSKMTQLKLRDSAFLNQHFYFGSEQIEDPVTQITFSADQYSTEYGPSHDRSVKDSKTPIYFCIGQLQEGKLPPSEDPLKLVLDLASLKRPFANIRAALQKSGNPDGALPLVMTTVEK